MPLVPTCRVSLDQKLCVAKIPDMGQQEGKKVSVHATHSENRANLSKTEKVRHATIHVSTTKLGSSKVRVLAQSKVLVARLCKVSKCTK